jgi:acyl-ACP thioesterase
VRSESAVRLNVTELCGTGRSFGKSFRIDLIVLRISERWLPVTMEFKLLQTFREIRMASSATFIYINRDKNRTAMSVRRPIKFTSRTNAFLTL